MKLYEHEAKSIFSSYGVPIPKHVLATTKEQARQAAAELAVPVAVKAQVLVAGRGKAGGILFADTAEEAEKAAKLLLKTQLKGAPVEAVLVEEKISIKREMYFGVTVDRLNRCYVTIASDVGGVDIEEVAQKQPSKIYRHPIDTRLGFRSFNATQIAKQMGYRGEKMLELAEVIKKIFTAAMDYDAELAESNPLVETSDGKFVAVDARLVLDDNALFRHVEFRQKRLEEQRDLTLEEFEAAKNGLDYVKLGGDIGVAGNGAGLVMATMDMINLYGGKPANFLDMGGGAPPQRIKAALRIILSNPKVQVLFVNILGGITLCDEVARGIIQARKQLETSKPTVVRLVGTNEEEGKRILADAGMPVFDSMEQAAQKAVEFAKQEP
ncbi:MAG: ADP-forming succinate--CoA ligase subunit beta [Candidatus Bathyarchaeota archaeon]|nr:ADP-forming succinate--CoA ligase subunit beta [Candidatus Bathyarchaeota archaeon]